MRHNKATGDNVLLPGMIVRSKAGHDQHRCYLVVRVTEDRVWLTDGALRPVDKLKRKNRRHIKIVDQNSPADRLLLTGGNKEAGQRNAAIRRMLVPYTRPLPAEDQTDPVPLTKEES